MPRRKLQVWDRVSRAMRFITHEHAQVHDGKAYSLSIQSSLANAGSFSLLFRTPTQVGGVPEIHHRIVRLKSEDGPMMFSFYEAPFINSNSLGTLIVPQNMERDREGTTGFVSSMSIYTDPFSNVASLGERLEIELIPSTGVQGGATNAAPTPFEWVLLPAKDYLVRVDNQSGGNTQITLTDFYYETAE